MLLLLLLLTASLGFASFKESIDEIHLWNPSNYTQCQEFKDSILQSIEGHPYFKIYNDSLSLNSRIENIDCNLPISQVWIDTNDLITEMGDINTRLKHDECIDSILPELQGFAFIKVDHISERVTYKGAEVKDIYYSNEGSINRQSSPYNTLKTFALSTNPYGTTDTERFQIALDNFIRYPVRLSVATGHWLIKTDYEAVKLDYIVSGLPCKIDFNAFTVKDVVYQFPKISSTFTIFSASPFCFLRINKSLVLDEYILNEIDNDLKKYACVHVILDLRSGWLKDFFSRHAFMNYFFPETFPFSEIYRFTNNSYLNSIPVTDEETFGEYPSMSHANALVSSVWNHQLRIPSWSSTDIWRKIVPDRSSFLISNQTKYKGYWLLLTAPFIDENAGHFCAILVSKGLARTVYYGVQDAKSACGLSSSTLSINTKYMQVPVAERVTFETPFLTKARTWIEEESEMHALDTLNLHSLNDFNFETFDISSLTTCVIRTQVVDDQVFTILCDGKKKLRKCVDRKWYNESCLDFSYATYEPHPILAEYYAKQISIKVISLVASVTIVYIILSALVCLLKPSNGKNGTDQQTSENSDQAYTL